MARPGVTVVSSFSYRGHTEEFSNTFHFPGSAPSTPADWINLAAEFVTKFKALIPSASTIQRVYCYTDTDTDSVFTYSLADHGGTVAGTCATGGTAPRLPGDAAYWVRWSTGRVSSKGKAIYLRKYLHPAFRDSSDNDALDATMRTNVGTAAAAITSAGTHWPGVSGPSYDLSSPAITVSQYVTTRTLKRRGKRP